jgi:BMFP domain-containing protein YqiC
MQTNSRIFDDLARLATGALGTAQGVKAEWENLFHQRMERFISEMDLVPREEFDAIKEMTILLREENEDLRKRLEALEKKSAASAPKATARKAASKSTKASSPKS